MERADSETGLSDCSTDTSPGDAAIDAVTRLDANFANLHTQIRQSVHEATTRNDDRLDLIFEVLRQVQARQDSLEESLSALAQSTGQRIGPFAQRPARARTLDESLDALRQLTAQPLPRGWSRQQGPQHAQQQQQQQQQQQHGRQHQNQHQNQHQQRQRNPEGASGQYHTVVMQIPRHHLVAYAGHHQQMFFPFVMPGNGADQAPVVPDASQPAYISPEMAAPGAGMAAPGAQWAHSAPVTPVDGYQQHTYAPPMAATDGFQQGTPMMYAMPMGYMPTAMSPEAAMQPMMLQPYVNMMPGGLNNAEAASTGNGGTRSAPAQGAP